MQYPIMFSSRKKVENVTMTQGKWNTFDCALDWEDRTKARHLQARFYAWLKVAVAYDCQGSNKIVAKFDYTTKKGWIAK